MSLRLTYVGHATVLLELDGVRLLTDPLLRERVWHLRRSSPPPDVGAVDAVLVSHGHHDHLDVRSLAQLGRERKVVVPRGLGMLLRSRGFSDVVECVAGDELEVEGVRVEATPAEHPGSRLLVRAQAIGYLVRGSATVYFAGDTDLFPGLAEIGAAGIDVALLPVWGWGTRLDQGHLDPQRAAEAARRLQPRLAVPIHWGTYSSPQGDVSRAPAEQFAQACEGAVDVRILAPGEQLRL